MSNANTTKLATLTAKLLAAQALVAKYQGDIDALTKYDSVAVGDLVGFEFGRGEGKQNLQGEVIGRGKLENGVEVINVLLGKGTIDADIKRIPLSTINAHIPAKPAAATEVVTDADAVIAADPLGSTVTSEPVVPGDPLAGLQDERSVDALLN